MHRVRTLFITFTSATLLLIAIGSASARNLSYSAQTIRVTWVRLNFENTSGASITCPMTMEGSFHTRTIAKVANALIGYITRAAFGTPTACTGGEFTVLAASLPWHLTYEGFTGTLPTISSIRLLLLGTSFQFHGFFGGVTCLARSEARNPMHLIARLGAGGRIESIENEAGSTLPLTGSGGLCTFARGRFVEDRSTVTILNSTTPISITLI